MKKRWKKKRHKAQVDPREAELRYKKFILLVGVMIFTLPLLLLSIILLFIDRLWILETFPTWAESVYRSIGALLFLAVWVYAMWHRRKILRGKPDLDLLRKPV